MTMRPSQRCSVDISYSNKLLTVIILSCLYIGAATKPLMILSVYTSAKQYIMLPPLTAVVELVAQHAKPKRKTQEKVRQRCFLTHAALGSYLATKAELDFHQHQNLV